jgi:uncharacterized repeat protein (TIGR01451 family)
LVFLVLFGCSSRQNGSLVLTVSATPDTVAIGGLVTYTIKVGNPGKTAVRDVVLTELVPKGARMATRAAAGGTVSFKSGALEGKAGDTVTWTRWPTLQPGETKTVSISATVSADPADGIADGSVIHHLATVSFAGGSIQKATDTTVRASIGLSAQISPASSPVRLKSSGPTLATFVVNLANSSTSALLQSTHGLLRLTLPKSTGFYSATPGGASLSEPGTVELKIASLPPGAERRYTVTVALDGSLSPGSQLEAKAEVLDDALTLAQSSTAVELASETNAIAVAVSPTPDQVAAGNTITFTMKVSNMGTVAANNVVLTEVVPAGTRMEQKSALGGAVSFSTGTNSGEAGDVATWGPWTLAAGEVRTVSMAASVLSGVSEGTLVHHIVNVTSDRGAAERATAVSVRNSTGLSIQLDPDQTAVRAGDNVTFAVNLTNTSTVPLPAAESSLTITVPDGTRQGTARPGQTPNAHGGTPYWAVPTIAAGTSQRIMLTVTTLADRLLPGALLESEAALITSDGASDAYSNALVAVVADKPLSLSVEAAPDPVVAGGLVTYTMKVSNSGTTAATNVVLSDVVPSGMEWTQQAAAGGAITFNTGAMVGVAGDIGTWGPWTLSPGETRTVSISARVSGGATEGAVIRHLAAVTSSLGEARQSTDVVVRSAPGLTIQIDPVAGAVQPGGAVTFAIDVANSASVSLPVGGQMALVATVPEGTSHATWVPPLDNSMLLPSLAPGGHQRFLMTVDVDGTVLPGTLLQSTGEIFAGVDTHSVWGTLHHSTATVEVVSSSPLGLTVTATPDPVLRSGPVSYTMEVSNRGTGTLSDVFITEIVPPGLVFDQSSTSGGSVTFSTGGASAAGGAVVTWTPFVLGVGETKTVSIQGSIAAGVAAGTLLHHVAFALTDHERVEATTNVTVQ